MSTASYNTRPRSRNLYKNGKRRGIFTRIIMGIFPHRGDGIFESARKVIFLGAMFCFIYFGGSVALDFGKELVEDHKNNERLKIMSTLDIPDEVYSQVIKKEPDILPEYIMAYNENNDLVGHVRLPDITSGLPDDDLGKYVIDYPVYKTDDNKYYLEHAADRSYSKGGAIFADYRNRFSGGQLSGNTVLYGHNITTGKYFSKLSRYYTSTDMSFYKAHPIVQFNTIYEKSDWKVFACVLFNTQEKYGEVYKYNFPEFKDKDNFNTFILDIMDRSVLFTDVDIQYGDNILTLSTCFYPYNTMFEEFDTRVAIFARKVREGESSAVNTDKASYNWSYKQFELQKQRLGNTWRGRIWDTGYLLSYDEADITSE